MFLFRGMWLKEQAIEIVEYVPASTGVLPDMRITFSSGQTRLFTQLRTDEIHRLIESVGGFGVKKGVSGLAEPTPFSPDELSDIMEYLDQAMGIPANLGNVFVKEDLSGLIQKAKMLRQSRLPV